MKFDATRVGASTVRSGARSRELPQHLRHLEPREMRAEAEMWNGAERDVWVRLPKQLGLMWTREHFVVTVGALNQVTT